MHSLTWRTDDTQRTWTFADGLFDLTPHIGGHRAAVAASGDCAVLIMGDSRALLSPGCSAPVPGGEIEWRPPAEVNRPTALAHEPTRGGEGDSSVSGALVLLTAAGDDLPLAERPVVVGRHPACDLRLDDARVSTVHCMLQRLEVGVRVLDLQSTNGTVVNGARVSSVIVGQRATIEVGGVRLRVCPALCRSGRVALQSRTMRGLEQLLERVARTDVPVLVEGESGVGKDGIAKRVHEQSGRAGPFVPLNAAAISPALAASELFGHVRGAFTGAERDRDGAFLAADGGTLFLDEIAELPLTTQAELLRVVEQRRVRRVGANDEIEVDVRLVTATNRDLAALVRAGDFRADLYHRICVVPLCIPPLRERPDDLEQLAEHFVTSLGRELSVEAWEELRRHRWPGNIRELHNALKRACVITDEHTLDAEDLRLPADESPRRQIDRLVHDTVVRTYHANQCSIAATARELGVHRATVYRHIRVIAATEENPELSTK